MRKLPPGVRQRGSSFQARWRDTSGRQRSATFDTAAHAHQHLLDCRSGRTDEQPLRVTVGEWAPRWQAAAIGRPSTRARDDSYLRNHILSAFADRALADIAPWDIQEWISSLSGRLAPASVHKVHGVMSKLMRSAVSAGILATNPCRETELPPVPDVEARFLTPVELDVLDRAVRQLAPHWGEVIPLLADTGVRIGEAAALTVGDVDLSAGSVTVRHTLVEVQGRINIGPPKSRHGRRVIPMLTEATAGRLHQRIRRLGLGPAAPLLGGRRGGWLRPNAFRRRVFTPAVAQSELGGRVTPHTLRHTAVALWIACGVTDPFRLSRWTGHRDVSTVYRFYGHLLPDDATFYRQRLSALRNEQ